MRGQKTVILYDRVVADVIAAPERDIVTNLDERLDRVVFQDKAVVSHRIVGQKRAPTAHVTDQLITQFFGLIILGGAQLIHPGITQSDKHLIILWRVTLDNFIKID